MKHCSILITIIYFFGVYNLSAQVTGTFTADNSYAVYKGNQSSVSTKLIPTSGNGHTNNSASQIFNPSQRSFNVTNGDYLYIIAWSDDRSCQGLLGEFSGISTIKTGDAVCRTYQYQW